MFERLYRWTLSFANGPHAILALMIVAFAESSFFPIPPDVLLVPMCVAAPRRSWLYAFICTIASVLGGILGYAIGLWLYDSVGLWLINLYHYGDQIQELRTFYDKWGAWFILLKGLTPIPFKLVTIISGILQYNFPLFVALAFITRGARFFILALILYFFGEPIGKLLEKYFGWFLLAMLIIVIAGFALAGKLI